MPPEKGQPQFTSRALRPGDSSTPAPKKSSFNLGSLKGPSKGPLTSSGKKPLANIGKGIPNMPGMKPPSFGGRPSSRKR